MWLSDMLDLFIAIRFHYVQFSLGGRGRFLFYLFMLLDFFLTSPIFVESYCSFYLNMKPVEGVSLECLKVKICL